jgi:hypothetical protein
MDRPTTELHLGIAAVPDARVLAPYPAIRSHAGTLEMPAMRSRAITQPEGAKRSSR